MPESGLSVAESLAATLPCLSLEQQQRVADYARRLSAVSGQPGRDQLRELFGSLDRTEATEMLVIIEQGCGQVDADGW